MRMSDLPCHVTLTSSLHVSSAAAWDLYTGARCSRLGIQAGLHIWTCNTGTLYICIRNYCPAQRLVSPISLTHWRHRWAYSPNNAVCWIQYRARAWRVFRPWPCVCCCTGQHVSPSRRTRSARTLWRRYSTWPSCVQDWPLATRQSRRSQKPTCRRRNLWCLWSRIARVTLWDYTK